MASSRRFRRPQYHAPVEPGFGVVGFYLQGAVEYVQGFFVLAQLPQQQPLLVQGDTVAGLQFQEMVQ